MPNYWPERRSGSKHRSPNSCVTATRTASHPQRPPLGHPVVANGQVFVTDGYRVFGYDLVSAKQTERRGDKFADPMLRRSRRHPTRAPALTAVRRSAVRSRRRAD